MTEQIHIAVVDDEPEIRETVGEYLALKSFRVSTLAGGAELRKLVENDPIDLAILDINMPNEDGLSLARFLRAETSSAIIMLTAAGDVVDRIIGLEMGADDYLAKPVDLRELLARVKSVLRRRADPAPSDATDPDGVRKVRFGKCVLDFGTHELISDDGEITRLTAMEFDLLNAFADHPNHVLSRDRILDMAHNRDWDPYDRSIDIRIARIRKKIESDSSKPKVIKTVRGTGYLFVSK